MSRATVLLLVLLAIAALLVLGVWVQGPADEEPPLEEPVELPDELDYPALYRAEAEGSIGWTDEGGEEVSVAGRVRADFVVYPDDRVEVSHLTVWMDDVDVVVGFDWWESGREGLRCTRFSNARPFGGTLSGDEIIIPPGVEIVGRSYAERSAEDVCGGAVRVFDIETGQAARAVHDPAGDHFRFDVELEVELGEGTAVTLTLEAVGGYLDRPPVAVLETASAEEPSAEYTEGCPDTLKGKPPIALANGPEGLRLHLRSASYDLDGFAVQELDLKRSRHDIRQERWLHSDGGRFRYLRDGRTMGPVLFATGREHRLLLMVIDRQGSQDRHFCHFQVEEPGG